MGHSSIALHQRASISSNAMILHILDVARAQGLDQRTLARRIGISPESLSRLKHGGNCRLTTALALANAAGLQELIFKAGDGVRSAATVAAKTLSAGRSHPISADRLIRLLEGGNTQHSVYLYGFFEELPIPLIHNVILDEGLDYGALLARAQDIDVEGDSLGWLKEMAGDGLANPA